MTIHSRKSAFDKISNMLAILRYDIEQHQVINDMSLNIHGENFFRDIFNFIYNTAYANANSSSQNSPYIDLVDHHKKKVIQITTTRTKEKILNSVKALSLPAYKWYELEIFYLLEKATPNNQTIDELEAQLGIDLKDVLKDSSDLVNGIAELEEGRLIELCERYFEPLETKYTHEIVLNLACKKLVKEVKSHKAYYDDPLASIESTRKIEFNRLNPRVAAQLSLALDFTPIISDMDDSQTPTELRNLIVEQLYKEVLLKQLKAFVEKPQLAQANVDELQALAHQYELNFSMLIDKLRDKVSELIEAHDFIGVHIPWVIVAFYFELCFVGRSQS